MTGNIRYDGPDTTVQTRQFPPWCPEIPAVVVATDGKQGGHLLLSNRHVFADEIEFPESDLSCVLGFLQWYCLNVMAWSTSLLQNAMFFRMEPSFVRIELSTRTGLFDQNCFGILAWSDVFWAIAMFLQTKQNFLRIGLVKRIGLFSRGIVWVSWRGQLFVTKCYVFPNEAEFRKNRIFHAYWALFGWYCFGTLVWSTCCSQMLCFSGWNRVS